MKKRITPFSKPTTISSMAKSCGLKQCYVYVFLRNGRRNKIDDFNTVTACGECCKKTKDRRMNLREKSKKRK